MIKPFLILQLRPEDEASDDEFAAFIKCGNLSVSEVRRIRIEKDSVKELNLDDYSGVIVGGGPSNASTKPEDMPEDQKRFEAELFELFDRMSERDFPYLGACYGLGVFSKYLGGHVSKEKYSELVGAVPIHITEEGKDDQLLAGFPATFKAFAGHKEACQDVPPGAVLIATSDTCPVQMIRYQKNMYAAQFHPELDQEGLVVRINVYRHAGYFPPEDADMLIASAKKEEVEFPKVILENFVNKYSQPKV